jgi:hypothetical protein
MGKNDLKIDIWVEIWKNQGWWARGLTGKKQEVERLWSGSKDNSEWEDSVEQKAYRGE